MTRKDYLKAAKMIRWMGEDEPVTKARVVNLFCALFEGDSFDRDRFVAECNKPPVINH